MSEIINNSEKRKELLKHLILQLHNGEAPEQVKARLQHLLVSIPYHEVVEVEQELINEGLPEEDVLAFCDIHTSVLEGAIDNSGAKQVPDGHPVDTFKQENRALEACVSDLKDLLAHTSGMSDPAAIAANALHLKAIYNKLSDVDKHYKRKEFLLFPYMEKIGITGPPKVMWGKHDETRAFLKKAHKTLSEMNEVTAEEFVELAQESLIPAIDAIEGMIMKEEEILLPMCLDALSEEDWYRIYLETPEFGYCLYDPQKEWQPDNQKETQMEFASGNAIRLSSGSFDMAELEALFKLLPVDITFVDKDDKVKFFSHSPNRVFERNRSIIGRDVRMCHPPGSVHIVEQIISDFKEGKHDRCSFWISSFMGRFIHIEYIAMRGKDNEYLGVVEVTQDISALRKLEGDQRLLSYETK